MGTVSSFTNSKKEDLLLADEPRLIHQILALSNREISLTLGPALWAALKEAEQFVNRDRPRFRFRRSYVSEFIPEQVRGTGIIQSGMRWFERFFSANRSDRENSSETFLGPVDRTAFDPAKGRYSRTYEPEALAEIVRNMNREEGIEPGFNLIITDRELMPSPEFRYLLWWYDDERDSAAVISTWAMDPEYWRMHDDHRSATVKQRARVAMLWSLLHAFGGRSCDNETCFLYGSISSFSDLDQIRLLGAEHKNLEGLTGYGFDSQPRRPDEVQEVLPAAEESGGG